MQSINWLMRIDNQSINQLRRRIHPYALTFKNVLFSAEVGGNWYEYDEESVGGKGFENVGHFLIRNDRSATKLHLTIRRPKTSSEHQLYYSYSQTKNPSQFLVHLQLLCTSLFRWFIPRRLLQQSLHQNALTFIRIPVRREQSRKKVT